MGKYGVTDIDKGWSGILRELKQADGMVVDVGVQAGETSEDGQDMAMIAAYNEFGTDQIPERAFTRRSFDENLNELDSFMQGALKRVVLRKLSASQALELTGQKMTGIIQRKIVDGPWTANAPVTIRRKGSDRPLIDTGRLRQSIRHIVRRKS